jgi:lipopolysaccharide/colanic/teichoic acid biosynthesis glycosyltransferase
MSDHTFDDGVTFGRSIDVADKLRRILSLAFSSLVFLVLLIPMLIIAAAVMIDSDGPALFRQRRVGRDGKPFVMFKFRTMKPNSDDARLRELIVRELNGENTLEDGSSKLNNDTRVTRIGNLLRRTSLDELPQILNVLRGQMALVGPRPCLEWEAALFPAKFHGRFSVRPGITGLWQVSGRSALTTLDMLELDLEYVRRRSLMMDIAIVLRTVPTLLRRNGAR